MRRGSDSFHALADTRKQGTGLPHPNPAFVQGGPPVWSLTPTGTVSMVALCISAFAFSFDGEADSPNSAQLTV